MNQWILDLVVCPETGERLRFEADASGDGETGRLMGATGRSHQVVGGIPRFALDQSFTESFGFQWRRFDVRESGVDEDTLVERSGVTLSQLRGQLVLDAGCGGGRYSRVAADHGARIVGVDRSVAVDSAQAVCRGLPNAAFVQADLLSLPFAPASFDLVFSIGVLHHSPDPAAVFRSIADCVKPGGRLSIWVYRRNTWVQEGINRMLRGLSRRLPRPTLLGLCRLAALLGAVPLVNRTINKVVNFSNHPRWINRVCDNFDWYSAQYQHHHTPAEVIGWFQEAEFREIFELPPGRQGRLYRLAHESGVLVGSGVNVTGIRP